MFKLLSKVSEKEVDAVHKVVKVIDVHVERSVVEQLDRSQQV